MAILRVLKWIVITITVVVLAAVLYLGFADLNWMKPRIESAVADATGRRLQLAGDFDLDIVPSPSIVMEDVSLSNADWGPAPMLATVSRGPGAALPPVISCLPPSAGRPNWM